MKNSDLPPPVPTAERPPSASASASEALQNCAASLTRQTQLFNFARFHQIPGLVAGGAAERGQEIHSIAAKIPFGSYDFSPEPPFKIRDRVDPLAKAAGLSGYEAHVITTFVRKRDMAINYLLDHAPVPRDQLNALDLELDEKRMQFSMPVGPYTGKFSGLPDVKALTIGPDDKPLTALVVDYKGGFTERKEASVNAQISSLVGLIKLNHPTVQDAYAAVEQEVHIDRPAPQLAHFGPVELEAAAEKVRNIIRNVTPLLEEYLAGDHVPSAALDEKLDAAATAGKHCLECNGRTCCGKLKRKLVVDFFQTVDRLTVILKDHKDLKTMTPDQLSETLAMATAVDEMAKLYGRLREDAEKLTLDLNSKGITVPGTAIKTGSARIGLTETNPTKLHEILSTVLGPKAPDMATFLQAVAKPVATQVRAFMAETMGIPETKVEEELATQLKEKSPLKKGNPPTSVLVTRDLADILEDKRAEYTAPAVATPLASAPGTTPSPAPAASPSVGSLLGSPPAGVPEGAPVEPPKRRRRSAKAAALAQALGMEPASAPASSAAIPAAAPAPSPATVPSVPEPAPALPATRTEPVFVEPAAPRKSVASFF